ncbi:hypothetical protein DID78_07220, partial [Candidatus Marinamargulisbacteria bacterium SCGC AG-343-D04]
QKKYNIQPTFSFNELKKHYIQYADSLSIVIYASELSNDDYLLIKDLRSHHFYPEFILLSSHHDITFFKHIVNLGIYSIHDQSIHPAILYLDVNQILSAPLSLVKTLEYRIKQVNDMDLLFLYQYTFYRTPHTSLQHSSRTLYKTSISNDFMIQKNTLHSHYNALPISPHPKILIIEDDHILNNHLTTFLNKEHFQCYSSLSASDGIKKIKHLQDLDLILLDIGLPHETGDTLIPLIRKLRPQCSIIMLTAYKDSEQLISCINQGAQDYITKPFIPSDLLTCLTKHLKMSKLKTVTTFLMTA